MLVPVMMLERDPMTDPYRVSSKATEFLNAYERAQELLKIWEEEDEKKVSWIIHTFEICTKQCYNIRTIIYFN